MPTIGTVVVRQQSRSTVASPNFSPKPNVAVSELTDVSTSGVQNGYTLVYNSTTGKYQAAAGPEAVVTSIVGGSF